VQLANVLETSQFSRKCRVGWIAQLVDETDMGCVDKLGEFKFPFNSIFLLSAAAAFNFNVL
jgi:hypothetical protein